MHARVRCGEARFGTRFGTRSFKQKPRPAVCHRRASRLTRAFRGTRGARSRAAAATTSSAVTPRPFTSATFSAANARLAGCDAHARVPARVLWSASKRFSLFREASRRAAWGSCPAPRWRARCGPAGRRTPPRATLCSWRASPRRRRRQARLESARAPPPPGAASGSRKTAGTADAPAATHTSRCVKNAAKSASSASAPPRDTRSTASGVAGVAGATKAPSSPSRARHLVGSFPNAPFVSSSSNAAARWRASTSSAPEASTSPRATAMHPARTSSCARRASSSARRKSQPQTPTATARVSPREPRDARRRRRRVASAARLGCTPNAWYTCSRCGTKSTAVASAAASTTSAAPSSRGAVDVSAGESVIDRRASGVDVVGGERTARRAGGTFSFPAVPFPASPSSSPNRRSHALYASAPYAGSSASTSHVTFTTAPTGAHANAAESPAAQARKGAFARRLRHFGKVRARVETGVVTSGASRGGTAARVASAASRSSAFFTAPRDMPLYSDCDRPPSSSPSNPIGQAEARATFFCGACLAPCPSRPSARLPPPRRRRRARRRQKTRRHVRGGRGVSARTRRVCRHDRRPRQRHRSVGLFVAEASQPSSRADPSPRRPRPLRRLCEGRSGGRRPSQNGPCRRLPRCGASRSEDGWERTSRGGSVSRW